ncbi:MAG: diguanylate cyclase [Actinobacteria bacterium]|nr:diguanylate cyclase [Actinomycetota bacterium]
MRRPSLPSTLVALSVGCTAAAALIATRELRHAADAGGGPHGIERIVGGLLGLAVVLVVLSAWAFKRLAAGNERARAEAEQQSLIDALTGLHNRRHAEEAIAAEITRAGRNRSTPGVLILDIDHFKQVNDVYGHHAGDVVIREVGRRIRCCVRQYDTVARWGGEEFAVVLPGATGESEVRVVAERIRKMAAFAPVQLGEGRRLNVTVSVGGVVVRDHRSSVEAIVDLADRALYAAKRRGRNRAVLFTDIAPGETVEDEPESVRLAQALALAVSVREASPERHCEEVAELAARIAMHLGLSDSLVMRCRLGGWIHDIGKLAIPDRVIAKQSALDDEEREILHSHVTLGAEIVRGIPAIRDAASAVLYHHERWDGSGYPEGLANQSIPLEARVVACADAFSAITAGRPYQPPLSREEAIGQLRRSAGRSLDPAVVEALAAVLAQADAATGDIAAAVAA